MKKTVLLLSFLCAPLFSMDISYLDRLVGPKAVYVILEELLKTNAIQPDECIERALIYADDQAIALLLDYGANPWNIRKRFNLPQTRRCLEKVRHSFDLCLKQRIERIQQLVHNAVKKERYPLIRSIGTPHKRKIPALVARMIAELSMKEDEVVQNLITVAPERTPEENLRDLVATVRELRRQGRWFNPTH